MQVSLMARSTIPAKRNPVISAVAEVSFAGFFLAAADRLTKKYRDNEYILTSYRYEWQSKSSLVF